MTVCFVLGEAVLLNVMTTQDLPTSKIHTNFKMTLSLPCPAPRHNTETVILFCTTPGGHELLVQVHPVTYTYSTIETFWQLFLERQLCPYLLCYASLIIH